MLGASAFAAEEAGKTSVWKIEGKSCTVYLAGSVHLLKPADYPLPEAFEKAYADSKAVYFEILLDEMSKPQTQERFLKLGTYPHGETIRQDLTPESYAKLQDFIAARPVLPMAVLQRMRPWMAAMTLSVAELRALGCEADKGMDSYFNAKARKEGKARRQLETPEFQMALFGQLNKEEQEAMLLETLECLQTLGQDFDGMIHSWREGDMKSLEELFLKSMKGHPKLMEILLYARNRSWIPEIEKILAGNENTLVIVGAGHLAGEGSVLDLLQKAGYAPQQQ
jgi:uncharacterized protein YbaP (TraB family)